MFLCSWINGWSSDCFTICWNYAWFCTPRRAPTRRQTSNMSCDVTKFPWPGLALRLPKRIPITDRFIEFYMPRGCSGSSFSVSHDRSYQRRQQDLLTLILLAKDVSPPFCPVTTLYQYCNIWEIALGHFNVTLIKLPFLFTNSMSHFSSADLTVVWTAVGTRVTAFALRRVPCRWKTLFWCTNSCSWSLKILRI